MTLEVEKYYHIYNRANGFENLFVNDGNYDYFLKKLYEHLGGVVDIYSYCLMPNHFHLLVKVKLEDKIVDNIKIKKKESYIQGFQNLECMIDDFVVQQFANFFNAYSKAFNKQQSRTGSLFQKGFKRKEVEELNYIQNLILYIHNNPTHHGFIEDFKNWQFSSYHELIGNHHTELERNKVLELFGGLENFKFCHLEKYYSNLNMVLE